MIEVELREQIRAIVNERKFRNNTAPLVQLYQQQKMLADLGYRFDADELEDWEVQVFTIIEDEIDKELKRKALKEEIKSKRKM